jgi:hypothetical protein
MHISTAKSPVVWTEKTSLSRKPRRYSLRGLRRCRCERFYRSAPSLVRSRSRAARLPQPYAVWDFPPATRDCPQCYPQVCIGVGSRASQARKPAWRLRLGINRRRIWQGFHAPLVHTITVRRSAPQIRPTVLVHPVRCDSRAKRTGPARIDRRLDFNRFRGTHRI